MGRGPYAYGDLRLEHRHLLVRHGGVFAGTQLLAGHEGQPDLDRNCKHDPCRWGARGRSHLRDVDGVRLHQARDRSVGDRHGCLEQLREARYAGCRAGSARAPGRCGRSTDAGIADRTSGAGRRNRTVRDDLEERPPRSSGRRTLGPRSVANAGARATRARYRVGRFLCSLQRPNDHSAGDALAAAHPFDSVQPFLSVRRAVGCRSATSAYRRTR